MNVRRYRYWGLVQDGRAEGHALISSCDSTKVTASCWTTIIRRMLEPTKGGYPHPKTKEKPQYYGRRSAITKKSKPIPAGWATHKLENNNTKKLSHCWERFWAPHWASQPGDLAKGLGIPRKSGCEGQKDLLQDFHKTRGNRDSTLRGHKQNLSCTRTQEKGAVTPQETEPDLPASVGGSPVKIWVSSGSPQGWEMAAAVLGSASWREASWRLPLTPP